MFFSLFLTFLVKGFSRVVFFSCIVQFSRCCSVTVFIRRLNHYITYLSVCQVLFSNFFRKFSANFLSEVQKTFPSKIPYFSLPLRPTALLLYHAFFQLSSRRNSYFSDVFCRISTISQKFDCHAVFLNIFSERNGNIPCFSVIF